VARSITDHDRRPPWIACRRLDQTPVDPDHVIRVSTTNHAVTTSAKVSKILVITG
jgi:hypothetical protein